MQATYEAIAKNYFVQTNQTPPIVHVNSLEFTRTNLSMNMHWHCLP
jgi:hypothetical protein